jgi:hypothetical protein
MSLSTVRDDGWAGTHRDRVIGAWMARTFFGFGVAYAVVVVAGFISLGNLRDPLPDPYLAVAEILILAMGPIMVMLMVALHRCAPPRAKAYTAAALGWMLAAAATTMANHFVELTIGRNVSHAAVPGYERIFGFQWPSVVYGVDIVAWDVFFSLALLFAVPAFTRTSDTLVRRGFIASGALCLIGLVGPAVNDIAWRGVGIFGYTVVFPLTCLALSSAFRTSDSEESTETPSSGEARNR